MNNKKIDIEKAFAQLRHESKPTPLNYLVEARESGALFALKQSVSASLSSAKMLWLGMGFALAVSGGILYGLHAAHQQEPTTTTATAQRSGTLDMAADKAERETIETSHAVTSGEVVPETRASAVRRADNTTAKQMPNSTETTQAVQAHRNNLAARRNHEVRVAEQVHNKMSVASGTHPDEEELSPDAAINSDIMAANYLHVQDYESASIASHRAPEPLQPVEEFPLLQSTASRQHKVSFTVDGAALTADIVHLQGEFQISNSLSGGLVFGVGNVAGHSDSSYSMLLVGAQVHYYALGDFNEGLQIGAQVLFSTTDFRAKNTLLYENGRVLSIIPYAGYKLATESGFTLNLQAGVGAATPVYIPASAVGSGKNTEYKWHVSPRIHFNVGWSL